VEKRVEAICQLLSLSSLLPNYILVQQIGDEQNASMLASFIESAETNRCVLAWLGQAKGKLLTRILHFRVGGLKGTSSFVLKGLLFASF
jgi:hypothetical protein